MADMNGGKYDGSYKYDAVVAKNYENDRLAEPHWQREDKFIEGYLYEKKIDRLLDLPLGTGRFIPHYNRVRNLVGIDISEDMLREARAKTSLRPAGTTTILKTGNVEKLAEQTGTFDVTIVCRLFHLLPPAVLEVAIAELCRVTKGEVVAQSYGISESQGGLWQNIQCKIRGFSAALASKFERRKHEKLERSHHSPAEAKPWSHIQSYSHNQSVINSHFLRAGFRVESSTLVDHYLGSDVRMTVYVREKLLQR